MPHRVSALSLRCMCLQNISHNLEYICYGLKRTDPALNMFLNHGCYEAIQFCDSPLSSLPANLLSELFCVTSSLRPCPHHVLHLLIQPCLEYFRIPQNTNKRTALNILAMRCRSITHLDIPHCKVG